MVVLIPFFAADGVQLIVHPKPAADQLRETAGHSGDHPPHDPPITLPPTVFLGDTPEEPSQKKTAGDERHRFHAQAGHSPANPGFRVV